MGLRLQMLFFYDLPVYRLSQSRYEAFMGARLNDQIENLRRIPGDEPPRSVVDSIQQHQYRRYGPWRFNEIVGQIRLHFLGTQLRGEYFSAEKKRNPLGRTRVFTYRSIKLAAEINISPSSPTSNAQVWEAIQTYVDRCRGELAEGRLIDDSLLSAIGPHVDWLKLLGWDQP